MLIFLEIQRIISMILYNKLLPSHQLRARWSVEEGR